MRWKNNSNEVFATNEDGSSRFFSQFNNESIYERDFWILNPSDPTNINASQNGVVYEHGSVIKCQQIKKMKSNLT